MSIAIGISMGSESATLAVAPASVRDANGMITSGTAALARPTIVAAEDGERSTPAYAAVVDGQTLVGAPARNASIRYPKNSIGSLVPVLSNVQGFEGKIKANVEYKNGEAMLKGFDEAGNKDVAVSGLLTDLLALMVKLGTAAAAGEKVISVVVSVPRYANAELVLAALKKVEMPDAQTVEVIYDDCAAMLANGMGAPTWAPKLHHHGAIVVDAGANATTVSVLTVTGGVMTLLASDFILNASGLDVDAALAKNLVGIFKKKERCDPGEGDSRPMRKLLFSAEKAKKTLTMSQSANCEVEAFFDGHDLAEQVNRGALAAALGGNEVNFFKKTEELVEKVLAKAIESNEDLAISHVVLHGGIMRIPAVQTGMKKRVWDVVENLIENDDQLDMFDDDVIETLDSVPGDEASCLGATIQASLIANGCDQVHGTTSGLPATIGKMERAALTFDIGFWNHSEAPVVDGDGQIEIPDEEEQEEGHDSPKPHQAEQYFSMVVQKGSPLPMEMNLEVPAEASLLLIGRTGYEEYVPLANSVNTPAGDAQNLHLVIKADGQMTITPVPVGESADPTAEPLLSAKIF